MQTFHRVCIEEAMFVDGDDSFTLKRGQEYLTSHERDGKVKVFSTYWFWAPARLFAGAIEFTPVSKSELTTINTVYE